MIRRLLVANRGEIAVRVDARLPRARHRAGRGLFAMRSRRACTSARPTRPSRSAAGAGARATCASTRSSTPRRGRAPTRSIPATASCPRTRALCRGVPRRRRDVRRPAARSDRGAWAPRSARAALMERAGVPVVPGETPADQRTPAIAAPRRRRSACPSSSRPSAGGGGKGMRVVTRRPATLDEPIAAARREARRAFGDGTLYVERLVERPRHVEIQVFADAHGDCVHLFERECSIQRRHQKVDRGDASPGADAGRAGAHGRGGGGGRARRRLRQRRHGRVPARRRRRRRALLLPRDEHAAAGRAPDHRSGHRRRSGPRATAVAAGAPLPWTQAGAGASAGTRSKCACTPRIREQGFLPQAGRLLACRFPQAPGLRVDAGVERGDAIPVQYDPLHRQARRRTRRPGTRRLRACPRRCARTLVFGVRTNATLLARILAHPRFVAGDVDTGFVADEREALLGVSPSSAALAAAEWVRTAPDAARGVAPDVTYDGLSRALKNDAGSAIAASPWTALRGWRG